MSKPSGLVQGTLDLLILKILALEPMNGWAMGLRLKQISDDVLEVNQGSLYPALYRLENRDWIAAEWGVSPAGRRAKFYSLRPAGKKQLALEEEHWKEFYVAVNRVLGIS